MVMKPAPQLKTETRTIPAGEFKAKCLQLMDEVNEKKLTLIITKRGKPVSQVTAPPEEKEEFVPLWGRTPGVRILGDIMKPLPWPDPVDKWRRNGWLPKRKKAK
jgi:prevent-host-death family protein